MPRARLVVLLSFFALSLQAQSWLDSTLVVLKNGNAQVVYATLNTITEGKFLLRVEPDTKKQDSLCLRMAEKITAGVSTSSPLTRAIVYSHFGAKLIITKKTKEGQLYLQKARQLAVPLQGIAVFTYYDYYTNVFFHLSRLDSAIFYAKRMLDLSVEIHNDSLETYALQRVGSLFYGIQQYQQSARYYKILSKRITDERGMRNNFNNIGLCFRNQHLYDSALFYFNKGLVFALKYDTLYIGLINGNMGDTYFMQGKYKEAIPYLETELAYSTRKNMTKVAIDCMNTLTMLYLNLNDIKKADYYYNLTSKYAPGWGDIAVTQNYYKLSSSYYQKKKNYEKSIQFFSLYQTLSDSLETIKNIQHAAEVSAQYDFDNQRKEIDLLQQQNLLQQAENKYKSFLLYGSFFILLLAVALLVLLFLNYKQKKKSMALINDKNETLEKVNEELVTSLERIEEQNQKISELATHLTEVNASKDKLFSIIGHDLRNPINSLKGLLKLSLSGNLTMEEFKSFSNKLNEGVEHIDFTLNNMLQWAHSQMQGMKVDAREVDIHKLIVENINFLSGVARSKNIQLINEVTEKKLVKADVNQINLVIRNLMSNAIKFTPENGTITLSAKDSEEYVRIQVKDTGTGMDEETLAALFKTDSHVTNPGTQGEKGSGLGLILCYEMIEKNKGTIGVDSKLGEGSTFWFNLSRA
jgi:signal transduction histidine kinase